MSNLSIVKSQKIFRDAFLDPSLGDQLTKEQKGAVNVLLYYVWRGLYNSVTRVIKGEGKPDLVLICIATYKSFLPLIQLIRLGYAGDAFSLMRSQMERIALMGYLNENQNLLGKYKEGKLKLPDEAIKWAKDNSLPNWVRLYSLLSNIAHQRQEGIGGSIFDENKIGDAIRYMLPSSKPKPSLTNEALTLVLFGVIATDPIAASILSSQDFPQHQNDEKIKESVDTEDLISFTYFLQNFVAKYQ
jgi:hypothetical protein